MTGPPSAPPGARGRWTRILNAVPPSRRRWAVVALAGWWLSPLTAWNDAFTNIPLSLGLVYLLRALGFRVDPRPAAVVVYLLTNVLGLFMLWLGMGKVSAFRPGPPPRRWMLRVLARVVLYAALALLSAWAIEEMLSKAHFG